MRISDWSSDVCSSDLFGTNHPRDQGHKRLSRQIAEPPCLAGACFYRIGSAPSESSNMEKITLSTPPSAIFVARNLRMRTRSEESRVGQECVSTCRSRCSLYL